MIRIFHLGAYLWFFFALILVTNSKIRKIKLFTGCFSPVLGFFVFAEVFNDVMFTQTDDRMVGLWEYQREGLGMILAGISIIFFWYKEGDD